jgi:hypothetical protein
MRLLVAAAVGVAAVAAQGAAAGPRAQTLYSTQGSIAAFTQDASLIAWFAPRRRERCNSVHVLSLQNGLRADLPEQSGVRNVTCLWPVGASPVRLALAGTSVLWTLRQDAPIPFDYLLGAAVGDRVERRFQEIAHTTRGSGLWLGGVSGDGPTLVYAVTSIDFADEAGCLAGTGTCELKVIGGGVYRMEGRKPPKLVPGTATTGAVAVAASEGTVAYVPSAGVGPGGKPLAGADLPIEVVDAASGDSVSQVAPQGTPLAIALTQHVLAVLARTPLGLSVAWYDPGSGSSLGSVPVSSATSPELTANDRTIVYRVGRSIRAVDTTTHNVRTLLRASATPIGLSLEGRRLAWAENLKGSARIRALYLTTP